MESSAVPLREDSPARQELEGKVIDALRKVFDPEIPVNIYELGLVYSIDIDEESRVGVRMTLTAPACPVAGTLPGEVERMVKAIPGVSDAKVDLIWDPPWRPEMMSKVARIMLGM
jgi:FeS assembly SUF system protein